jgi:thiol-disulfide isomerase/thioredoxin
MKVFLKVLEYSFYILVVLCFTFALSFFNGGGRKFYFNPSEYPILTESTIPPDFQNKNKVIYFWATWCSVCETNLPLFKSSYSMLNGRYNTEFISVEEGGATPEHVKKYIEKNGITFPTVFGNQVLLEANKVHAFPTTLFVNSKNEIKFIDTGIMNPLSIWIRVLFLNWS